MGIIKPRASRTTNLVSPLDSARCFYEIINPTQCLKDQLQLCLLKLIFEALCRLNSQFQDGRLRLWGYCRKTQTEFLNVQAKHRRSKA
jgi:hypothetical protein